MDWLVNDDTASNASSNGGRAYDGGLNGGAAEFIQHQQVDMSPCDMLRLVLGEAKSDEQIERALAENGYDLSATIAALMGDGNPGDSIAKLHNDDQESKVVIGKSTIPNPPRPTTPSGHTRSGVVCRFFLSTGSCLRADCRFSHDLSKHICKYVDNTC